jgi:hypothetical protein
MSTRSASFIHRWIRKYVRPTGEDADLATLGDLYARRCRKAAAEAGIPEDELEAAVDDLPAVMADALEATGERRTLQRAYWQQED